MFFHKNCSAFFDFLVDFRKISLMHFAYTYSNQPTRNTFISFFSEMEGKRLESERKAAETERKKRKIFIIIHNIKPM